MCHYCLNPELSSCLIMNWSIQPYSYVHMAHLILWPCSAQIGIFPLRLSIIISVFTVTYSWKSTKVMPSSLHTKAYSFYLQIVCYFWFQNIPCKLCFHSHNVNDGKVSLLEQCFVMCSITILIGHIILFISRLELFQALSTVRFITIDQILLFTGTMSEILKEDVSYKTLLSINWMYSVLFVASYNILRMIPLAADFVVFICSTGHLSWLMHIFPVHKI